MLNLCTVAHTAQHKMYQYALSLGAVLRKADLLTKSGKDNIFGANTVFSRFRINLAIRNCNKDTGVCEDLLFRMALATW